MNYRCILCYAQTTEDDDFHRMNGATAWRTHGNYGSRIIDDPHGHDPALEIHICDTCLLLHQWGVYAVTNPGPDETVAKWEPPKVDYFSKELIRIFRRSDGQFYSVAHGESSTSGNGVDDLIGLLKQLLEHEEYMTTRGHPFGIPKTDNFDVDTYMSLVRAQVCRAMFGYKNDGYPYAEEQERIWSELSEDDKNKIREWMDKLRTQLGLL